MSAPPFVLVYTNEAVLVIQSLGKRQYADKLRKVRKALRLLAQQGPAYPGLRSHQYQSIKGPNGEAVWESYVENHTPSAWRIWWTFGPGGETITIITIGPHP